MTLKVYVAYYADQQSYEDDFVWLVGAFGNLDAARRGCQDDEDRRTGASEWLDENDEPRHAPALKWTDYDGYSSTGSPSRGAYVIQRTELQGVAQL